MLNQKITILVTALLITQVSGHGRLLDPPGRSSMWRYGFSTEPNWSDMQIFCGGMDIHYKENGGKCGICGDNYADPKPRANENGGIYGKGIIAKTYTAGGELPVFIELTQEHMGYFEFGLCDLAKRRETKKCFKRLHLVGGKRHYKVTGISSYVNHTLTLKLPSRFTCDRCVLRWYYRTGNNRGVCDDGSIALGCGDQETFINCADIAIH